MYITVARVRARRPLNIEDDDDFDLTLDARNDREGFRGLWRRVKPIDKPDEVSNHPPVHVLAVKF